ncbi:hypothetical protein HYR99_02855 [Candidatus Poribacteria bacterium]|nr:hypothetical protein [Candidatus Poribacteria bacterium]
MGSHASRFTFHALRNTQYALPFTFHASRITRKWQKSCNFVFLENSKNGRRENEWYGWCNRYCYHRIGERYAHYAWIDLDGDILLRKTQREVEEIRRDIVQIQRDIAELKEQIADLIIVTKEANMG